MIPSKVATVCLVGFVLLANFIEARPAPDETETDVQQDSEQSNQQAHHHSKHTHTHHYKSPGGSHTHHYTIGGGNSSSDGGKGGSHHHHYSTGGSGKGSLGGNINLTGNLGGDLNLKGNGHAKGKGHGKGKDDGGAGGNISINLSDNKQILEKLSLKLEKAGFSPDTVAKFKKIILDSHIDLSKLDLNALFGGGAGGQGGGPSVLNGGIHKFDGKDSLQPAMCHDSINDRYGVGKHFVRGTRDVGFAILSEAENILDPLFGLLTQGLGQGLKALLCAIEDGFSDFGSDWDSATDIAKHGLVNFFKLQGPAPVLGIPVGIGGIAGEAVKAAASIAGDAVSGVGNAVSQLVDTIG